MIGNLKILKHQGKQYIPDVTKVDIPGVFRGRPIISSEKLNEQELQELKDLCPTNAIGINPVSIDMGRCTFCGECAFAFPNKIKFTKDYKIATNTREDLIIKEGQDNVIELNTDLIRKEISSYFSGSLKLRQVSTGGDGSNEMELGACNNVNFDMSRFGIDFVSSPRHADGLVITGAFSENMAASLQICYDAIPEPKIIILAGIDAISGGIFEGSPALDRGFLDKYHIDLYVPGNPIHPLTFINGILDLIKKRK